MKRGKAAVLQAKSIVKSFRESDGEKQVLKSCTLSIYEGEFLGLVGASGSGKSTLARILAGLLPQDAGTIDFRGEDCTHPDGEKRKKLYRAIQMIFQSPISSFDPRHTLGKSVAEPLLADGAENALIKARVEQAFSDVGLSKEYSDRYPHEVSGGECQRAAIARALLREPTLLLSDEATSALDVLVARKIVTLLKRLSVERNMACLFITHDISLLESVADRILVMHGGEIVEEGSPKELFTAPKAAHTKELLAANCFTTASNAPSAHCTPFL